MLCAMGLVNTLSLLPEHLFVAFLHSSMRVSKPALLVSYFLMPTIPHRTASSGG